MASKYLCDSLEGEALPAQRVDFPTKRSNGIGRREFGNGNCFAGHPFECFLERLDMLNFVFHVVPALVMSEPEKRSVSVSVDGHRLVHSPPTMGRGSDMDQRILRGIFFSAISCGGGSNPVTLRVFVTCATFPSASVLDAHQVVAGWSPFVLATDRQWPILGLSNREKSWDRVGFDRPPKTAANQPAARQSLHSLRFAYLPAQGCAPRPALRQTNRR